ncbi:MAG: GTP-binding protein [Oribacterium sp.]|jgi:G3E family GTPase|nr:GTP-binding protein [Oribacterium sp.]MDY6308699.1 GTP-binding protein [Oribacterium sp.]MDY6317213.1 GTP-binding protein [Oribacterium sp.]
MVTIDLVTGFLGAGKTTFIEKYARWLIGKGEKLCILENDYGAINVDAGLLQDIRGENCDVEMVIGGDGKEAHQRRFRTKLIELAMLGFNRVIVEPSGIYDVDEFFDTLMDDPLDRMARIGSVIAIVDASLKDTLSSASEYVLASEIAEAGSLVFSRIEGFSNTSEVRADKTWISRGNGSVGASNQTMKSENTSEAGASNAKAVIGHLNRALETVQCRRRISEKDCIVVPWDKLTDADFEKIRNAGYHSTAYVKRQVDANGQYRSVFFFHVKLSPEKLEKRVQQIFADEACGHVFRIKGYLPSEKTDGSWIEINAVRKHFSVKPAKEGQEVLIVIGERLDEKHIESYFRDVTDTFGAV